MASYKIELTKTAQKNLKNLDFQIPKKLIVRIEELKNNPFPPGVKKLVTADGYRLRVGDYRIVYDVIEDFVLVKILKVGHRKDIYRE